MEENWKALRPIGGDGDEDQKLCRQMQLDQPQLQVTDLHI